MPSSFLPRSHQPYHTLPGWRSSKWRGKSMSFPITYDFWCNNVLLLPATNGFYSIGSELVVSTFQVFACNPVPPIWKTPPQVPMSISSIASPPWCLAVQYWQELTRDEFTISGISCSPYDSTEVLQRRKWLEGEVPILSPEKPYLLDAKVRAMFDWKSRLDDLFLRSKAMNFIPHIFVDEDYRLWKFVNYRIFGFSGFDP